MAYVDDGVEDVEGKSSRGMLQIAACSLCLNQHSGIRTHDVSSTYGGHPSVTSSTAEISEFLNISPTTVLLLLYSIISIHIKRDSMSNVQCIPDQL